MQTSEKDQTDEPVPTPASPNDGISAIGIELGSLYFKAVSLGPDGSVRSQFKEPHQGMPFRALDEYLARNGNGKARLGLTSRAGLGKGDGNLDPVICLHTAVRSVFPGARNILEVGGGRLTLIRMDEGGGILSIHHNSLCAAGTGSFLDAQAERMGIDYAKDSSLGTDAEPPSIATRCAVFAKSDLIYRQQEGFSKTALWSGLCRGLADALLRTLTNGRPLSCQTVLCGGVALNETFVWWLRTKLEESGDSVELQIMPQPEYAAALGAALLVLQNRHDRHSGIIPGAENSNRKRRPPLELKRSRYPEELVRIFEKDGQGNEINVYEAPGARPSGGEFLGLDIGSTSTKLAVVDGEGRIILDVYRPTGSDPVSAVQKLFSAAERTAEDKGLRFSVLGAATTGSGRKLIGQVINADLVLNEISAHAAGAVRCDPDVETIFEIGGQDSKYMSVKDGRIADANMNYVCAAGTGSFVEELAAKLGYRIEEIGGAVMGAEPPFTSSRCTVFMEQDVFNLLNRGVPRREAAGAVIYSVIENYLEQVVGRRRISPKRVFFQGATARNRGLVAAIENILDVEVVVSPYCHVMGAYGAALTVMEKMNGRPSKFRGFDIGRKTITLEHEKCGLCSNVCRVSHAVIKGERESPVWGMKCGRDEKEKRMKSPEEFALFRRTVRAVLEPHELKDTGKCASRILVPRVLSAYQLWPFWKAFFEALGIAAEPGPAVDDKHLQIGNEYAGSEFCLPVKAAIGQTAAMLRGEPDQALFVPFLLADYESPGLSHSRFCPYVETLPSLLKAAFSGGRFDTARIISPIIDFRLSDEHNAERLAEALGPVFPVKENQIRTALAAAHAARRKLEEELQAAGAEALERIRKTGKPAILVAGRPYNSLDEELSRRIPAFIAECGFEVIPMNGMPWKPGLLSGEFKNLFWSYGQRILSALIQTAGTDGLYAVYLSNFGCGPDSFLLSYAESIMGEKPFLILEVDEHGSSGSYETRIEAFLDVIRRDREKKDRRPAAWPAPGDSSTSKEIKKRTIWIPVIHPVGNRLFAAAFRNRGYDARNMPLEDETTFALGKRYTRGAECLPAALTLGSILNEVRKEKKNGKAPEKDAAVFLPTSTGPCRYGQYRTLDRIVMDRLGLDTLPLLSPGAHNAYYGLEPKLRTKLWSGIVAGDILYKMRCRVAPYEITPGDAEETMERWVRRAEDGIESGKIRWKAFLTGAKADFRNVPVKNENRPLVGIVGEVYVRLNPFANSQVIKAVEKLGGEAWLSPLAEWILYTAWIERYLAQKQKTGLGKSVALAAKWRFLAGTEHRMYGFVREILHDRLEPRMEDVVAAGRKMVPPEFQGESILTLGRAALFKKDGADLVINCAPFGCMHGNITSAIFEQRREDIGLPVVNIFYDGTENNVTLDAFIHEAAQKRAGRGAGSAVRPSSPVF